MAMERIISRSRPALPLIGRVWFNYNRVLTGSGIVIPAPPRPDYILKNLFIILFYTLI